MEVAQKIRGLIEEEISKIGYILDDVIYEKEGNNYFLRITIDKEGYITIEDCVKVNNLINPILDREDPIENKYILEVSSKEKGQITNE